MENRKLTNEEKVRLLETIVLNGDLMEVEKVISEIKGNSNTILEEPENKKIDEASIYSKEALGLVKEDLETHQHTEVQSYDEAVANDEKVGPVLKKVPNPWGESGAKTVSPGEINY